MVVRARTLNRSLEDFLPATGVTGANEEQEDAPENVLAWASKYRRIEGRAFSLARFAPLRTIYADDHPHICVMKPAQRGVSEYAINRACFALDLGAGKYSTEKNGLNVAYLFPTQAALSDFSKERVSALRQETPHLERMFGQQGFRGVTFKQVGNSYLYLRGAWSEENLLSFAADVLILDEYDRMDPGARALARRRMAASVVRHELDVSTPTIPGTGIHELYLQSDRMRYWQPCPACGEAVVYDFLRDVRLDDAAYAEWKQWDKTQIRAAEVVLTCPQCKAPVDDLARCVAGEWRADDPRVRTLRGYQIPALAFPMADLPRYALAAVSADPSEQQEFWRSDMGLPYDASGSRITPPMLAALDAELPGGQLPDKQLWREVTLGIDVGARFHYRLSATDEGGHRVVRKMGTVATWGELTNLMVAHQVRRCVIDALPELHACAEWAAKFPARVVRAYYPASVPGGVPFKLALDKTTVNVHRTMILDEVFDTVASLDERWPTAICRQPEIVDQLGALVRVIRIDDRGQDRAEWVHTKPDHYHHATAYDRVALGLLRDARVSDKLPIIAQGSASGWQGGRK